jgi:hypothetical protein
MLVFSKMLLFSPYKTCHENAMYISSSSTLDYYSFGMLMPGRTYTTAGNGYRYGFNGQERDNEVSGIGNINTAEYWEYDTRLGRRWNVDPVFKEWESSYSCFSDNPLNLIDINGDNVDVTAHAECDVSGGGGSGTQVAGDNTLFGEPITLDNILEGTGVSWGTASTTGMTEVEANIVNYPVSVDEPLTFYTNGSYQGDGAGLGAGLFGLKSPQEFKKDEPSLEDPDKTNKEWYLYETKSSVKSQRGIVPKGTLLPYFGITSRAVAGNGNVRYNISAKNQVDRERAKNFLKDGKVILRADQETIKGAETIIILLNSPNANVSASTRIDNLIVSTTNSKSIQKGIALLTAVYGPAWEAHFKR